VLVHEGVSHGGPVVEPMIQIASPRLFLVVAQAQCWINGCYRGSYHCPLGSTVAIFGWAGLKTSLVFIRASIPHVLIAIRLGKEQPQADTACCFGIRSIKSLGSRNDSCQIDNVLERCIRFLRIGGWCLQDIEKSPVLVDQRLFVGVEVRRRNSEFIGPPNFGGNGIGEVFVCAHHADACKIECLSRQVRQRLLRVDLRAPLAQDRLKIAYRFAIRIERASDCFFVGASACPIAGDIKLRLRMAGETSDATVLIVASMAMQTGGVKNSPRARAAEGAAV